MDSAHEHIRDDLHLALQLADEADAISLDRFRAVDLVVDTKADMTPVTDADRAVEDRIREILAAQRPDDAVIGEERGGKMTPERQKHGRAWILDPIDGTKNFVRGVPVWGTLIALIDNGVFTVGCISAPAMKRRWWAGAGLGAYTGTFKNPRRLHVSQVGRIEDCFLIHSEIKTWENCGLLDPFIHLATRVWRSRGYGDFLSYMMVAEGGCDVSVEPELELYDMAAAVAIIHEAGGTLTSLDGKEGPWYRSAICSNTLLHQKIVDALGVTENSSSTTR